MGLSSCTARMEVAGPCFEYVFDCLRISSVWLGVMDRFSLGFVSVGVGWLDL